MSVQGEVNCKLMFDTSLHGKSIRPLYIEYNVTDMQPGTVLIVRQCLLYIHYSKHVIQT